MKIPANSPIPKIADSFSSPNTRRGESSAPTTSAGAFDSVTISQAAQHLLASSQVDSSSGAHRDFTHMTSNQMQGVADELWKAGKIDLTQLRVLQTAGVPIGKMGAKGELIRFSDSEKANFTSRPLNYIQISEDRIDYLEKTGLASDPTSGYNMWKEILSTLQSLQTAAAGDGVKVAA